MSNPTQGYIESSESRALRSINQESYDYKDQTKFMTKMVGDVSYMASYMRKMQQGIDSANQNFVQQIQSLINDFIVLIGGLGGSTGFDFGDLKYVFQAIGALFGFDQLTGIAAIFPINLFAAAWHFISTYIFAVPDFGELINSIIDSFLAGMIDLLGDIPIIGEAAQQLAVFISGLRDDLGIIGANFWQFIEDLGGAIGGVFDTLGALLTKVYNQWIQPIVDFIHQAIGNPIGQAFNSIVGAISKIFNLASGADSKATQALGSAKPLWETLDGNGEVSTPLATADATVAVTATASRGGFIRCVGGTTKSTISCIAYKTGTVSTCFFDVYRLEANGSANLVCTTDDQQANLQTTATVLFIELDDARHFPIEIATNYLVICRITGFGTVTLQGRVFPTATIASRPLYPGILRDPSTTASPASITSGTLDGLYVPQTPYFQLGSLEDILPQSFFVDFTTVSSSLWISTKATTLGIPFNIQHLTAGGDGILRVVNASGVDVSGYASIMYRYPVATENCRVGLKLAEGIHEQNTYALLFGRLDFSSYVSLGVNSSGCGIYRANGSSFYGMNTISTNTYHAFVAGDWVYLEYDDVEEKFYVYKNPDWNASNNRDLISAGGNKIFSVARSDSGFTGLNTSPAFRSGGVLMSKDIAGYDHRSTFVDDYICEDWINPAA
jgi:hypothetical protein